MSTSTLTDAVTAFLRHGQAAGLAVTTITNYRHTLGVLLTFLHQRGCRRVPDITPDDLRAFMVHVLAEGRKKRSRVQMAVLLKQVFRWFQDRGLSLSNPALGLPLPDDGEQDLADPPLSEAEVSALFAALPRQTPIDLRNVCLLELLYGCALRIAEAMALNVADIDFARQTVHVRHGKGGQDRLVPLMNTASAAVKDYLALRRSLLKGPDHGALLVSQYGQRWKRMSVYIFLTRLNEARGPDARHLHPHLFRHSIAVHLLRGKADIRYIQELLGHADLDTTKHYLRLVPGHLREDYDAAMPDIATGLAVAPHAL